MMHFHPKALNDASTKEEHEALMLAMYEGYTQLQAKLSTKTRTMFLYPLLLLSMRVTVETVFRNAYTPTRARAPTYTCLLSSSRPPDRRTYPTHAHRMCARLARHVCWALTEPWPHVLVRAMLCDPCVCTRSRGTKGCAAACKATLGLHTSCRSVCAVLYCRAAFGNHAASPSATRRGSAAPSAISLWLRSTLSSPRS